jgi:hypothetical protein
MLPQAKMPQRTGVFGVMPQKLKTKIVEATLLSLYFLERRTSRLQNTRAIHPEKKPITRAKPQQWHSG